jgi:LAGLIDADG DNA endonuclease family protein
MGSDNPTGADDQQETATPRLVLDPQWVVGFVDGEGCFCVSIHSHPGVRSFGWQINPVFQVSQHVDSRHVLDALPRFFDCGRVRGKGPRSRVMIFAVDRRRELIERIIPFFEAHPLVVKRDDFQLFAEITRQLAAGVHFTPSGFEHVVRLAFAMNANGKQRSKSLEVVLAGSSETARQARCNFAAVKIQSDLHGDMQSQAEMTWPLH